jgi:transcriptional regulator with XRE-family HTH domain
MISMPERNRQILQMRKERLSQAKVARRFKLSPSRIYLIEKRDAADRSKAERRARLRETMRSADDPDKPWPVEDLLDAVGLTVVTKKRLMDHFAEAGKERLSVRELMDTCVDAPVEGLEFMMAPLSRVYGVGKIGFWCVVNGLTGMDMGSRCNQEWQERLAKVKQKWRITGATPYSNAAL